MQKQIIILNGMARSGKGEFYNILSSKINCEQYSIVDPVRAFLKSLGISENAKSERWRKLMSDIKLLLEDYDDIPYQCTKEVVMDFLRTSSAKILAVDMRERQDISKITEEYGAIRVLINNRKVDIITSNPADANVFDIKYDYIVDNNGDLQHLEAEVDMFIAWMLENKCARIVDRSCIKLNCKYCNDDDGALYCARR